MHRLIYLFAMLLLAVTISGCASMSKQDCEKADWHAIGYNDGARGVYYSNLDNYRKSCSEFQITPDANAYQSGWNQGIRSYCTSEIGYRTGISGQPFQNICPADVAPVYLAGWQQGVQQYCTPDNGLRQGLAGYPYRGVCPGDMAGDFQDRYRLGLDVRQARAVDQNLEYKLEKVRKTLATEKDPHHYHDLLDELAHLRHDEERSEFRVSALEACASDDWYQVGLFDGESGNTYQAPEIVGICRGYGSVDDELGYRDGWSRGNSHYCTYDSGLYAGQSNQEYRGVCRGIEYRNFWGGYMQGIHLFQADRYEDHPRPQYPHEERSHPRPVAQPGHEKANNAEQARGKKNEKEQVQPNRNGIAANKKPTDKAVNEKHADQQKAEQPDEAHDTQPDRHGKSENRKPADKAVNKEPADQQQPDHQEKSGNNKPADERQQSGEEHWTPPRSE